MRINWGVVLGAILSGTAQVRTEADIGVLYPQVSLVSDYRSAGMSNSNSEPTLHGSLYLWRPDGFYGGVWISGVDYGYAGSPTWEVDSYAGRNFQFGMTSLALEVMVSIFPDETGPAPTLNFFQGTARLDHKLGKISIQEKVSWSPEGSYGGGETWQIVGSVTWQATDWFGMRASYGAFLSQNARDRKFWEGGLIIEGKSATFELLYIDTDLDKSQCFYSDWCEPSFVGKVTWNVPLLGFANN